MTIGHTDATYEGSELDIDSLLASTIEHISLDGEGNVEMPSGALEVPGGFQNSPDIVGTSELDLAITPTWTGQHTFDTGAHITGFTNPSSGQGVEIRNDLIQSYDRDADNFTTLKLRGQPLEAGDWMYFNDGQGVRTAGTGSADFNIYDDANSQFLAVFNEGGPIEVPSADLEMSSSSQSIEFNGGTASISANFTGPDKLTMGISGGASLGVSGTNVQVGGNTPNIKFFTDINLLTQGTGSNSITIRDDANSQDLAVFNEGGAVRIPDTITVGELIKIDRGKILQFGNTDYQIEDQTSDGLQFRSTSGEFGSGWFRDDGSWETTTGNFLLGTDRGAITGMDMAVTSTPTAGTEQSYSFDVDGQSVATVYAEADGAGGIQNAGFGLPDNQRMWLGTDALKASMQYHSTFNGGSILFRGINDTDLVSIEDGGGLVNHANSITALGRSAGISLELNNSGDLRMGRDILGRSGQSHDIHTGGSGGDSWTFYDSANAQDLAVFNEGGPIEFPNTNLELSDGNTLVLDKDGVNGGAFIQSDSGNARIVAGGPFKFVFEGSKMKIGGSSGVQLNDTGSGLQVKRDGSVHMATESDKSVHLFGPTFFDDFTPDSDFMRASAKLPSQPTSGYNYNTSPVLKFRSAQTRDDGATSQPYGHIKHTNRTNKFGNGQLTLGAGGTDYLEIRDVGGVNLLNNASLNLTAGIDFRGGSGAWSIYNGNDKNLYFREDAGGSSDVLFIQQNGGSIEWLKSGRTPELRTPGGGSDGIAIYDGANAQDLAVFNEGGNVEIPNGALTVQDNTTLETGNGNTILSNIVGGQSVTLFDGGLSYLRTGGSGTDAWQVFDKANFQQIAAFNEGGNVEIPNGDLDVPASVKVNVLEPSQFDNLFLRSNASDDTGGVLIENGNGNTSIARFQDNGNVEIPNGYLKLKTTGDATSSNTSVSSNSLNLQGSYWDSGESTSKDRSATFKHTPLSVDNSKLDITLYNSTLEYGTSNAGGGSQWFDFQGGNAVSIRSEDKPFYSFSGTGGSQYNTIRTPGRGSDKISLYDAANNQPILEAFDGGNVEIPNGDLRVQADNATIQVGNTGTSAIRQSGTQMEVQGQNALSLGSFHNGYIEAIQLNNGSVEIPNGDLDIAGNSITGLRGSLDFSGLATINTSGFGGDGFQIRDSANNQNIALFNEGGNVEIPNGDLDLGDAVESQVRVTNTNDFSTAHFIAENTGIDPAEWHLRTRGGNFVLRDYQTTGNPIRLLFTQSGEFNFRNSSNTQTFSVKDTGNVSIPNGDLSVGQGGSGRAINLHGDGTINPQIDWHIDGDTQTRKFSMYVRRSDDAMAFRERTNDQNVLELNTGGNIEIPNGDLLMGGNRIDNIKTITFEQDLKLLDSYGQIRTGGGGSGTFNIYDDANAQNIATFGEGGDVEIPNGNLTVTGNVILQDSTYQIANSTSGDDLKIFPTGDNFEVRTFDSSAASAVRFFQLDAADARMDMLNGIDMGGNPLEGIRSSATALSAGDLNNGEVAMDEANGRLCWKDGSGSAYYVEGTAL